MRIISTPLPAVVEEFTGDRPTIVAAFDTLVDEKGLVVGLAQGVMAGPDLAGLRFASGAGQLVLDRCLRHHQFNYPQGVVMVAGVAKVTGAKQRVRDVLRKAPPQALVLLLCADGKTYDAAWIALGIDFQAANQKTQ